MAELLARRGVNALPYHAGLDARVRQRHQDRFLREEGIVMVATIAFGMGIDKPTCALWPTSTCPKTSRATTRKQAAPGDGDPPMPWMAYGLQDVGQPAPHD